MSFVARLWFALTALVVVAALVIQIPVSAHSVGGHFQTVGGRVINLFFYFTIWSNLMVGATCLVLTLRPRASSQTFRVFRLGGIGITGTPSWP